MAQILFNFISPIRWIFMAIDSILFGLVDNCYSLIVSFANAELFTSDQISEIRTKIYFLITLVAFFRLAFLLVNSLINPEKLNDQNEGLSKIAFNFVIMLVLLVITPIVFNIALELQKDIVNENVITGIFSMSSTNNTCDVDQSELDKIKLENYKTYDSKSGTWVTDTEKYNRDIEYKKSALCSSAEMKALVIGNLIYPDPRLAREEGGEYVIKESACSDSNNCKSAITNYNEMYKTRNFKFLTLEKYIGVSVKVDEVDIFAYNYTLIVTTICAGFMLYILLSFAFDLGKRLLEMNLLMILSPLFIATYVDPKSAKSGPFNNWLKAIGSSYAGLFLRLAALAVMMLFVKILSINKAGLEPIGGIGFIILLFAGLTFCKELPKWLSGLLGMKDGMGGLGLGKKISDTPLLGGAAKKAGLMATGAVAGAATAMNARRREGRQRLKDARAAKGVGGLSGARGLARGIEKNGLKRGIGDFASDRRAARQDVRGNKSFKESAFQAAKQYGAAGILGAKAGGTTGIKADNIKGAFKGSIQSGRQTASGLGISGETFGQKVAGVVGLGTAALESQFGSYKERDDKVKKLANDKIIKEITAADSGITESGLGAGKIAMSKSDKKGIMESNAFGEEDSIKSFPDYLAAQYAVSKQGINAETGDLIGSKITRTIKDDKPAYTFTTPNGPITLTAKELENNMGGLINTKDGPGMAYMEQNWLGIQSQSLQNYQSSQNAHINAMQSAANGQQLVQSLTESLRSSLTTSLSDVLSKTPLTVSAKNIGTFSFDERSIQTLGKEINSRISTLRQQTTLSSDETKELSELENLSSKLDQVTTATDGMKAALKEASDAKSKMETLQPIVDKVEAEGAGIEAKIIETENAIKKAKEKIEQSKPKDEDKK